MACYCCRRKESVHWPSDEKTMIIAVGGGFGVNKMDARDLRTILYRPFSLHLLAA